MANRTFVRLGALTGACAAIRIAAAVCIAGYCAGTAISVSDQRERFVQFRAEAQVGSGAVAGGG